MNRQTNKEFSQECLTVCTWKKILLIALESLELCSTLAAIKELVNRRHKELITMKNFEKGWKAKIKRVAVWLQWWGVCILPSYKKRTLMRLLWWSSLYPWTELRRRISEGDFCGSFSLSFNGGFSRDVLCSRNHTQNDLEFFIKIKLWDLCNWPPLFFL